MLVCDPVLNVRFTALSLFTSLCSHHHYPPPERLSSCKTQTLYSLHSNSPFPLPLSPCRWHPEDRCVLFYCASPYYAFQMLRFLEIEGLWQPCIKQESISPIFPTALVQLVFLCPVLVILETLHFVFPFYSHTCCVWKFQGQGLKQSCRCRPTPQPRQHQI